jgi:hypothetical protein
VEELARRVQPDWVLWLMYGDLDPRLLIVTCHADSPNWRGRVTGLALAELFDTRHIRRFKTPSQTFFHCKLGFTILAAVRNGLEALPVADAVMCRLEGHKWRLPHFSKRPRTRL